MHVPQAGTFLLDVVIYRENRKLSYAASMLLFLRSMLLFLRDL